MSSISGANKTAVTTDYAPAGFGRHVLEGMFGEGPQSDYRAAGERAIKSVALRALAYKKALLESSVASPVESPGAENPFLRLLTELSLRRHRHAVEAKSPQANHFGKPRVKHSVPFRDVMVVLAKQYKEFGDQLKAFISAHIEGYLEAKAATSLLAKTKFSMDERVLGQHIQLTFEILDLDTLKKMELEAFDDKKGGMRERYFRYVNRSAEVRFRSGGDEVYRHLVETIPQMRAILETRVKAGELPQEVISEGMALLKDNDQKNLFEAGKRYKEDLAAGRCLGEKPRSEPYPDYEQMKIALAMMYYRGVFPNVSDPVIPGMVVSTNFEANARTHFLIVTLSHTLELNASGLGEKRMEPLSRYFVPLHIRPGESAKGTLSRMIANAAPYIVHQDLYSINETLQVCGALFKRVMHWKNSEPQRLLKEQMAGMIWLLAHNHRDERGTASETEWLERAIYKAHGFAVRALTTRMIDCVALATPLLSAFVPLYIDSLELEPLPVGVLPEEAALSQVPATCLATEAASPSVVGAPVSMPPLVAAGEKEPE